MALKNADRSHALVVSGLAPLQRALKRTEGEIGKDVRKGLREMAKPVRDRAQANVPHKTGRHSKDGPLKVKVGVTQNAVSVYSNQPYAGVIERGGRIGKGAVITRASASHYMSRAVQESRGLIEAGIDRVGREIERNLDS